MTTMGRRFVGVVVALGVTVGGPAAALAKQKFVYVHDRQTDGGIYGWSMDKNGGLTSLAFSPFPLVDGGGNCGGNCQTMAYSPKRKTLYAGGATGVSAWTVSKDGGLTLVPGSPFVPGGGDFLGTGVVEAGKRVFVYSVSFDDGGIYAWEANQDGSLTELAGSPFAAGTDPVGLATRKKFVFVANEGDDLTASSISSYLAAGDGTLLPAAGSPLTPLGVDFIYNASPDGRGKFLYADDGVNGIRALTIDKKTAALSEIVGSPIPTVLGGTGVLVTKKLTYSVGFEDPTNALQPFKIDKKGGLTLTGIQIDTPISIDTFASDKKGKRMVFAGFDGVATATIDDKKDGGLAGLDVEGFLVETNPNAAVLLTR
jgi:6-phosphogluconolactonase (cycloisomerase 2 family)